MLQPLHDNLIVEATAPKEATVSGIIIPDSGKEKPEHGKVVAIGQGKRGDDNELVPVAVNVGDKVMFSKYGFDEIKINGEEYYIISESNILGVIK